MRIGVHLPNVGPLCDSSLVLEVARRADALGYHSLWVNDHLLWDQSAAAGHVVIGAMNPDATATHLESLTTLAVVAGITQRVRLGTAVLVVPFRDPVLLAKQVATLDVYSSGRVTLGVGAGAVEEEFAALGLPFDGRGRIVNRSLRRMQQLWATGALYPEGTGPDAPVNFMPQPAQRPGPPLWIGGNTEFSLKRVAAVGDGWLPWSLTVDEYRNRIGQLLTLAAAANRPRPVISGQCLAVIDTGDGEALRLARPTLEHRYGSWEQAHHRAIWGTGTQIRAQLAAFADAGVEELVLGFVSGSAQAMLSDMESFASQILPTIS